MNIPGALGFPIKDKIERIFNIYFSNMKDKYLKVHSGKYDTF